MYSFFMIIYIQTKATGISTSSKDKTKGQTFGKGKETK